MATKTDRRLALLTAAMAVAVIVGIGVAVRVLNKPDWVPIILLAGAVIGVYVGLERRGDGHPRNVMIVSIADGVAVSGLVLLALFLGLVGLRQVGLLQFETQMPSKLPSLLMVEVFAIAIPEELFFRGTVQEGFDNAMGTRWKLFGAEFGWGLFLASALFAVGHIFWQGPRGLLTAIPGLGFGLLYERRRSVAGPVVFHVACNLFIRCIPFLG